MTFPKDPPWTSHASHLGEIISRLEGWTFGRWIRFASFGYGDQLHISMQSGWNEIDGFKEVPGLREFAEELDAAIAPICARYARKLREALSAEATKMATRAVGPGPEEYSPEANPPKSKD